MAARFYCESFSIGAKVTLGDEEAHHLVRVLRLAEGAPILLIDGRGAIGKALVLTANHKRCEVTVLSVEHQPSHSKLVLGFGIPKGPAQDFIVHHVSELGLLAFQPVGTEHSFKASQFNPDRWERIIPGVAKQCEETVFPEVREALSLERTLAKYAGMPIFFCDEAERDPDVNADPNAAETLVLVGPEGGWPAREREAMRAAGAKPFGLGRNRLRAETACLVAVALMKERMGELTRA